MQHPLELAVVLHTKFVTIHPFTDGNDRLGRALLNFVLRRNGYPALYLDLGHREKYLDAVEEGNKGDCKPIVDFLYEIYLAQHCTILEEIIRKIRECKAETFPNNIRLVEEFAKVRK
jgi:Fic family protein